MHSDVIRRCVQLIQTRQADSLLLGHTRGNKWIMRHHHHPERPRSPRDLHTDAPQSGDPQRLAPQLRALQRFLFPPPSVH